MLSSIHRGVGGVFRVAGKALDSIGQRLEVNPYVEQCKFWIGLFLFFSFFWCDSYSIDLLCDYLVQPSLRAVTLRKVQPQIAGSFVAPDAAIIGSVTIGANSSIWYGAVLRGDDSTITIGENSSVGDRVMIHCSKYPKDLPTVIGNNVTIASGVILHGCKVEDGSLVGEGAQVMDGARVEKNAIVAPGSLVPQGKVVSSGSLWAGVPATFQRALSAAEISSLSLLAAENVELATVHAKENAKSWQTIEEEEYDHEQNRERNEDYYRRLTPDHLSQRLGEVEGHMVPGRVFDTASKCQRFSFHYLKYVCSSFIFPFFSFRKNPPSRSRKPTSISKYSPRHRTPTYLLHIQ